MRALKALAVCAAFAVSAPAMAADKVTLTFWAFADWTTGVQGDELKRQISAFEQANPDITVNLEGKGSTDIIAGLIANGSAPGIDIIATQYRASSIVQANALADLSAEWAASDAAFKAQFTPAFVDVLTKNGKLLGVPYTTTASVLYRNLDVLKKAGVDTSKAPADWAEWLAQMKQVKDSGNFAIANQMIDWWHGLNYYGGVPGATFELKDGQSTLDKTAMTTALTFMKSTEPYLAPVNGFDQGELDLFTTNQSAFLVSGAWTYPSLQAAKGLNFDAVPVPGQTAAKTGGVYDGEFFGIPAASDHKAEAWKLLQYLSDAPNAAAFSAVAGRFIANDVALQDPAIKSNAFIQQQAQVIKSTINDAPFLENVPADAPDAFAVGLSDLKQGTSTPEQAAATIVDEYNAALQQ